MEAQMITTIPLYIDDGGAGQEPPVVFVHSLGGRSEQWAPQLKHLRRSRRALAVDLRGHGRSPAATDGDYRIETLAADLAAVLAALDLPQFVLVGHSLGGSVATAFAGVSRAAGRAVPGRPLRRRLADPC